ncbi:hypothetical protein PV327_006197 [Microctonus hyperodae]|uniref:Uncharacterized protein n=1 Tax=Microctonus hyperodae TaxID=165561 RepID=A0AA39F3S9_MICHY|nr:hypothetical protein PV327_006197 [Microctonus hyperodae]
MVERADGVKSETLNNFLASVLRAKDELNWIDRTIYSRTSGRKLREARRKLFWSDNSSQEKKKKKMRKNNKKKDIENLSDEISFKMNDDVDYKIKNINNAVKKSHRGKQKRSTNSESSDIKTLENILKLNKPLERSINNNHKKNKFLNVKRRYPINKNTDIEYSDYETNIDKRDLTNKSPTPSLDSEKLGTVSPEDQKKIDKILEMYEKNKKTTHKPPKRKYIVGGNDPESPSPISKTNDKNNNLNCNTTNDDILRDWAEIKKTATEILSASTTSPSRAKVSLADTRKKNENFGSSLLLANSPMSPKVVNGSFAAIYDTADLFNDCMKTFGQLRLESNDSPAMRRRIRGILMSGRQFSLDSRMDLVQGYASCGRPLSEPTTNLPLMKEDDDTSGINESNNIVDKNDTTIGKKVSINNDEIQE